MSPLRLLHGCALLALCFASVPVAAQPLRRHLPDELILKFRAHASAQARGSVRAQLQGQTLRDFRFIGAEHLRIHGRTVEQALASLRNHPLVEYVEPNYEVQALVAPNDPLFSQLYGMRNIGQTGGTPGADIGAAQAWDLWTGDPDLKIGVIDTGTDYTHPDLAANVWTNPGEIPGNGLDDDANGYVDDVHGYDLANHDGDPFDDNGHGTHVSGTIAAVGNNGIGVVGVNWRAKIVAIKFLGANGSGSTAAAIASVEYAIAAGVKLTNNSWGGGDFSQGLLDAINAAGAAGQLFVAAAGNAGTDTDFAPHYPSSYNTPFILSVAATNHDDVLAGFSNYGATSVDVAAPGDNILSTVPGSSYGTASGTSMASPHVAGAVAFVCGRFPALGPLQAKSLVLASADPRPALAGRILTGARLDLFRSVLEPDSLPPGLVTDLAAVDPGSNTMRLTWTATGDDGATGRAVSYDLRYSTAPITPENFAAATPAAGPDPRPAGSPESVEVAGLSFRTLYHFALRAADELGNRGPISNVTSAATLGIPDLTATPASFSEELLSGATATRTLTLANDGEGTLDFTIPSPSFERSQPAPHPFLPLQKGEADPRPGQPAIAGHGGPDGFGYRWVDSDEPGGPAFQWVDIAGIGEPVTLSGDDQSSAPIPMGMTFHFYGNSYSSVRVSTNGFLSFTDTDPNSSNQPLPNAGAPADLIAPFWDDLDFLGAQRAHAYGDGSRFIVSWIGVPHYDGGGPYTFQAILHATGQIVFQYLTLQPTTTQCTVGIQNRARTVGLQSVFNAPYLHDGLAVRFQRVPDWLAAEPRSGRIHAGQSADLHLRFDALALGSGDYQATVQVLSNDPDESPAAVPVQLRVIGAPDVAVTPTGLDFGTLFVGGTLRRSFTVANAGTDALVVSGIVSGDPAVTVDASAFTLAPLASRAVMATWVPLAPGAIAGALTISSNDPDEASYPLPMSGSAVPAPDIAVSPASMGLTLSIPETSTRTLTIQNTGETPLVWVAAATPAPRIGAAPDPAPFEAPTEWGRDPRRETPAGPTLPAPESDTTLQLRAVITDPIGDGGLVDLHLLRGVSGGGIVEIEMQTSTVISPTNFGGFLSLDTDQDPDTGLPPSFGAPGQDIGADFEVLMFNLSSGAVLLFRATGDFVGAYPVQIGTHSLRFSLPLAALDDDGGMDLTGVIGTSVGPTDWFPDSGHGSIAAVGWLSVLPESGEIAPGGSADLEVRFDTADLVGGFYTAALVVTSNDPDESPVNVPVTLTAQGAPDIAAIPASLDFGDVFVGLMRVLTVELRNVGSDPLTITGATVSGSGFVAPGGSGPVTVAPGGSVSRTVRFAPGSPCEACTGALTVASNDPDESPLVVPLTGAGLVAPEVGVSPASFAVTLPTPGTDTRTMSIANTGGSDLTFLLPGFGGAVAPMQVDPGLDLGRNVEDPRQGLLGNGGPDQFGYRWGDSDQPGGPTFEWVDIVGVGTQLPFQNLDETITGVPIGFPFTHYGNTFGTVNVCTHGWLSFSSGVVRWTNQPLPSLGAPENLIAAFWDDLNVPDGGQVWYQATPSRFVLSWIGVTRSGIGGPNTFQIVLYPDGRIVTQYLSMVPPVTSATIGIQNGARNDGLTVVFNAAYVHDNLAVEFSLRPPWLRASPASGVVPPGETVPVALEFSTAGLLGGVYSTTLQVVSNDPDEPQVSVPVTLTAQGVPDIAAVPASLDFGNVFVGWPRDRTVELRNLGGSPLTITGASVSGSGFTVVGGGDPVTVAPGGSVSRTVRYSPASPCVSCTGTLTVASNDPDESPLMVPLTGAGLVAPEVGVSPASFAVTLPSPGTDTRTLNIANTGGSDLTFLLPGFGAASAVTSYESLELTKGETDARPGILGSGGPDQFGHRWRDSDAPDGPAFQWVDITGVGTLLPIAGDDQTVSGVPIGFPFPYYGNTFLTVNVCTNGFLSFTSPSTQFGNQPLPTAGSPENMLAAFWDDLYLATPRVYRYNDGTRFILSWVNVSHLGGSGPYTFQIILHPDGRWVYQYLAMASPNTPTIGMQNGTRSDGLTVVFNATYVHDNLAVAFSRRPPWLRASPESGVVPPGETVPVTLEFGTAGIPIGTHSATLHVVSNDPDESLVAVPVTLRAQGVPDIAAVPASVNFGDLFVGLTRDLTVQLRNTGTDLLTITGASVSGSGFTAVAGSYPVTVAAGGSVTRTVRFAPGSPCESCAGTLTVASDDLDENPLVVPLSGAGLVPPDIETEPARVRALAATTLGESALRPTRSLLVRNTGISALDFSSVSVVASASPVVVHEASTAAKGETDPRPGILGSGGPDQFGHLWRDSDAPGGPAFQWVDITAVGTLLPITGDDQTVSGVPIGFSFPYYGNTFSTVNVCSNGFLSFTSSLASFGNQPLPSAGAPQSMLAVFWDDLYVVTPRIYAYNDGTRFVIAWVNVFHLGGPGSYSFQIVLYPDGRWVYQYLAVPSPNNQATIGMQNGTRSDGLTVVFNAGYVHNNLAVEFVPVPQWLDVAPTSGTVPSGGSAPLTITFDATGLEDGDYSALVKIPSNDPDEPSIVVPCELHVGVIGASLDVASNNVNRSSHGNWASCELALPPGLDERAIVPATVRLQRALPVADGAPVSYVDEDGDGDTHVRYRFDRAALIDLLPDGPAVPVEMIGELDGVSWFQALDLVRMFSPGASQPGGAVYVGGSTQTLEWSAPAGGAPQRYDLWFSADAGETWSQLATGLAGTSCTWTVPPQPTDSARLELVALDAQGMMGSWVSEGFRIVGAERVGVEGTLPLDFALRLAGANPVRGHVQVTLELPRRAHVTVSVHDVHGARMRELAAREYEPGRHGVAWDGDGRSGRPVGPGIYFLRMDVEGRRFTTRVALLD